MSSTSAVDVNELHLPHPRLRAEDWRSPLVRRLMGATTYQDGSAELRDSYRPAAGEITEAKLNLQWQGLKDDFDKCGNSYQEPVLTEFATLGLACVLTTQRATLEITEVTRRGEKVDYWLGERQMVLEISGTIDGDIEALAKEKTKQLKANPFGKVGYICVARYASREARLWFVDEDNSL